MTDLMKYGILGCLLLGCTMLHAESDRSPQPALDILHPFLTIPLKKQLRAIFSVPRKNTVATLWQNDAMILLEFKNDRMKWRQYMRNFSTNVYGPYEYLFGPVPSDTTIAYAQYEWFIIINFKSRRAREYEIRMSSEYNIDSYQNYNANTNGYLFKISTPVYDDLRMVFKNVVFAKKSFSILAEYTAGIESPWAKIPWSLIDSTILIYDPVKSSMDAFDFSFNKTTHPLSQLHNSHADLFRRIDQFYIHPTLPFGLLVEKGKRPDYEVVRGDPLQIRQPYLDTMINEAHKMSLWLARWDCPDTSRRLVPIFTDSTSIYPGMRQTVYADFQFSPDGKWVVFRDEGDTTGLGSYSGRINPNFIAIPINRDDPFYLGRPVVLGRVPKHVSYPVSTAWISDPLSFVATNGKWICKWDLGKRR
jgi:hypothetical protein